MVYDCRGGTFALLRTLRSGESRVKSGLIIVAVVAAVGLNAGTALAGKAHPQPKQLVREPCSWSWTEVFWPSCSVGPYATGAAPAVYVGHTYAGQDPDPRIRTQLQREFGRNWP
jgi:hypothetical protein